MYRNEKARFFIPIYPGFTVSVCASARLKDGRLAIQLQDQVLTSKSLRGEKPYVPKRLHGLGVSNLYHINI